MKSAHTPIFARSPLRAMLMQLILLAAPSAALAQAGAAWTTPAGDLQGTRYSSLNEITSSNVGSLVEEFSFPTNQIASHEGNPLVVNNVMYLVTPWPNKLIAMDLKKPGTQLWVFDPHASGAARGVACCDVVNRGASYAKGKVVYATLDGHVVAVDAAKGTQLWKTLIASPAQGEVLTGAPIIVGDNVIVGNSGGELGVRGWIQALNLTSGQPVWKAYNTGPDSDVLIGPRFHAYYAKDQGVDLGKTTWPGSMWQQGGSTVWGWLTYDPKTKLLFYGTAQPGVWNPDMRPGDNKWSSAIIARDPKTGEAVWAYQLTPHDNWDYDAINESIVADVPIDGKTAHVVMHFNKNGYAYMLSAKTGKVLSANVFAPSGVSWATGVDLKTGLPQLVEAEQTHQGVETNGDCPSALGGKDWEPAAYSLATHLFYVPAINFCQNLYPMLALYLAGTPFVGNSISLYPGGASMGALLAWDPAKGQVAWSVPEPLALYGGALATAGNVVFYGTLDRHFKAVDATTGALLFDAALECGVTSNPMTYAGPDGHQRVAIMTGLGYLAGGLAGGACPNKSIWGDDAAAETPPNDSPYSLAASRLLQGRKPPPAGANSGVVHVYKLP
jgi:alcohol dehydrogenase (cytochrome c)